MIERNYSQKDVMLISDFPLENEAKRGVAYSEPSQTILKDSLNTASFNVCKNQDKKYLLNSTTICYTYLSTKRYEKGDFDWAKSITNKKNIPEGENYHQILWLKDVWVSSDIWYELQDLIKQIKQVNPSIIIIAGKWSFMLLASLVDEPTKQLATIAVTKSKPTEKKWFGALNTYRSSILTLHKDVEEKIERKILVFPILTPAYLFLIKDKQFVVNRDYHKIARIYKAVQEGANISEWMYPDFITDLGLTKFKVINYLKKLYALLEKQPTLVAMDVETRHGYVDCIGIAYNKTHSMTIPFSYMREEVQKVPGKFGYLTKNKVETYEEIPIGRKIINYRNYWCLKDELEICELLWKVMLHPNCQHIGQNYNYDCQYYFHQAKLRIYSYHDTMIAHHVLYNYMQKDLAFLASIYCDYFVYWKDELDIKDNEIRWKYNGKDCIYTLIIADLLSQILNIQDKKLQEFYHFQQFIANPILVKVMNRGVRVDVKEKERLRIQFTELMEGCLQKINYIFNEEVNLNSTPQVKRAFKDLLGIKPLLNKKTKRETFGADAMLVYLDTYPEWRTLLTLFLEYKSIKVFVRTFLSAAVDTDGRMRSDYNLAGTKTYRLASRKNVFGNGMNLANIPSHGKIDLKIALQELQPEEENTKSFNNFAENIDNNTTIIEYVSEEGNTYEGILELPNCKKIFLPDEGFTFFNADYSGADAMVVAADSECKWLLDFFATSTKKLYVVIASEYLQEEITTDDPRYKQFKAFIHLTNYGGKQAKAAMTAGMSLSAANKLQKFYFSLCPEIPKWHKRIELQIRQRGYIENCFGARFWFTDLNDPTWTNKAYATIPQSTIAILCNKGLVNLEDDPYIQVLMQIHDAVAGQFPNIDLTATKRIRDCMQMVLPYKNAPITIPVDVETSQISYGDCH